MRIKLQAFIHLWSNLAYPFIMIAALLNLPVLLIKLTGNYETEFKFMSVFVFAFVSSFLFYMYSQKDVYNDWQERIIFFPVFMAGSMGLAVNNTKAVFEGLFNKKSEFVRTPKYKIVSKDDSWEDKQYVAKKLPWTTYLELIMAIYCFCGVVVAIATAQIAAIPFQMMFFMGFAVTSVLSIQQVTKSNRHAKRRLAMAKA